MSTSTSSSVASTSSGSVSAFGVQQSTDSNIGNVNLNSQDFLKIMVTSLQQQDPEQPQDANSYYQQVMQMSTYQATLNQESISGKLLNEQGLALVGKTVSYTDPNNNNAASSGVVTAVNFSSSGTTTTVNGSTFDVGNITSVQQTATSTDTSSTSSTGN